MRKDTVVSRVLIGTSSKGSANGIFAVDIDRTGRFGTSSRLMALASASFMAIGRETLYVAGEPYGGVSAWKIGQGIAPISGADAHGKGLCHLAVDTRRGLLFAASYTGGAVQSLRIASDGSIGELICQVDRAGSSVHPTRQRSAHPHAVTLDPEGERLCLCDLGTDALVRYRIRPDGALEEEASIAMPPGCGPRHMVFSPGGAHLYVVSELSRQIFRLRAGAVEESLSLPETNPTPSREIGAAAIRVSADGRHLYASNRGDDSIVCIALSSDGRMGEVARFDAGGEHPRDFILCGSDRFLVCACRFSGNLTLFSRDPATGALEQTDTLDGFADPVCLLGLPPSTEEETT